MTILVTGCLENLTELYIGNNKLGGIDAIPTSISRLSSLTVFHLMDNTELGDIPIELKVMNQLQEVSISTVT